MRQMQDEQLIARALAGHQRSYGVLVARHQDRVFRFLMGMLRNRAAAEDLTQDTFVKAARNLDRLRNPEAFGAWVVSIARRLALDWIRSCARGRDENRPVQQAATGAGTTETRLLVRRTLAQLSDQDREILLLVDLLGLSIQELTEHFSLGASAAKMRISRARDRFRRVFTQLTDEDIEEVHRV